MKDGKNIFLVLFLISLALIERLWLDLGPNVELITLTTFIAGFYLNKKTAVLIPLLVLAISDIFLGNTNIMLFTWSGYLVIGLISLIGQIRFKNPIKKIALATCGGVTASLWFYIWTNFGVWFLDSWNMYPKTLKGLNACYINGIPFLRNQLFSNLFIIPLAFTLIEFGFWFVKSRNYKFNYLKIHNLK